MLSLVATGEGLVFGGDVGGRFKALDDRTGKSSVGNDPRLAWQRLSGDASNGTQYVAVITGPSLAANSALRLTPDLHPSTGVGGVRVCPAVMPPGSP